MADSATIRIGDLISISSAPAVISLGDVERLRGAVVPGGGPSDKLRALVGGYSLAHDEAGAGHGQDASLRLPRRPRPVYSAL